jgi:hypothetical protein
MKTTLTAVALAILLAPAGCGWFQNDDVDYAGAANISMAKAIKTATDEVPGQPIEAKLTKEEDQVVYKIDIIGRDKVKQEVVVDARTGKVVKWQRKVKIIEPAPATDVAPIR